jgi:hypothetical protein
VRSSAPTKPAIRPIRYRALSVRPITQAEAERMRQTLKTIAGYRNPAATQDGAQAAARLARETLDELDLFSADPSAPTSREPANGDRKP